MTGLELSRAFFDTYGMPMLKEQFPGLLPHLAAGLIGSGSECFGFDDHISQDHDFEPGFCLFLPDESIISRQDAFHLERAYARLPRSFMGMDRPLMQPVGGPRHGVLRISEFFSEKTGSEDGSLSLIQWLRTPDYALAEAVNGELFYDGPGLVTKIRANLAEYPEDVRRKKLASALLIMAQSGQYNYMRCVGHGENGAAQLAVCEFVRSCMRCIFLLNHEYMPYYKWSFRALRRLPKLALLAELLEYLITTDNETDLAREKADVIEGIAGDIIHELKAQRLTEAVCGDLERHAYSVNDSIRDAELRNLHILAGE
ncbi:MAG: DUF4037 domain-containing protein [Clostridia bacterium]|nr:DUF4037 domain-containing protein [Clostridia bacterium]